MDFGHGNHVSHRDIILRKCLLMYSNLLLPVLLEVISSTSSVLRIMRNENAFLSIITYGTLSSMSWAFTNSCSHFRYASFVRSSLKILHVLFAKPLETYGYVWYVVLLDVEGMPLLTYSLRSVKAVVFRQEKQATCKSHFLSETLTKVGWRY